MPKLTQFNGSGRFLSRHPNELLLSLEALSPIVSILRLSVEVPTLAGLRILSEKFPNLQVLSAHVRELSEANSSVVFPTVTVLCLNRSHFSLQQEREFLRRFPVLRELVVAHGGSRFHAQSLPASVRFLSLGKTLSSTVKDFSDYVNLIALRVVVFGFFNVCGFVYDLAYPLQNIANVFLQVRRENSDVYYHNGCCLSDPCLAQLFQTEMLSKYADLKLN